MIKVSINLEQRHINQGTKNECRDCPVALALLEALPGASLVTVGAAGMNVGNKMITRLYHGPHDVHGTAVYTPQAVVRFIHAFDDGHEVEPFTFNLTVPDWATV